MPIITATSQARHPASLLRPPSRSARSAGSAAQPPRPAAPHASTRPARQPRIPMSPRTPKDRRPAKRTRSRTIPMRRLTRDEIAAGIAMADDMDYRRPQSRADCASGPRPCPFVSCTHHLYLDVNPNTGSIKINFPDVEVWEMTHTCALDVAERGGITLEEVGQIMNLTRERIRQVEVNGLDKLQHERFSSEVEELQHLDS